VKLLTGRHLTQREREVEREHRESFAAVLRGYAELGYSRSDVARILGFDRPDFTRRVLPKHDPHGEIPWPGTNQSNGRKAA
jgi:hypothetical protein